MKATKSKKESLIRYQELVPELNSFGFVVIPLDNKKPLFKRWNQLTKTPDKLYIFEGRNLGVLTGQASGITVLDIDVKDGGMVLWKNISLSYPEIITPISQTPSGGLHIYFRYNKNLHSFSKFKLRQKQIGWDLLNNDRQVVAPPSINPLTKKKYKWMVSPKDTPFSVMPDWLERYLTKANTF